MVSALLVSPLYNVLMLPYLYLHELKICTVIAVPEIYLGLQAMKRYLK